MSEDANRLRMFCADIAGRVDELRPLLVPDSLRKDALSAEAAARMDAVVGACGRLRVRAARPEVHVLVLGPLKAGKSTFMNVLLENPSVSQIEARPAYPCIVEVHGLEPGDPGPERSEFFAPDGSLIRTLPFEDGQRFLDELLDDFMAEGAAPGAEVRCDRVRQHVRQDLVVSGLQVVLFDSPGLFFSARLADWDASVASEYSQHARALFDEADVAVFVIRPEQLFFHFVAEWLRTFARQRATKQIFVLVNSSTRAMTFEDGRIVPYDQVARADELREYFKRHIADHEFLGRMDEGSIAMSFADLLDVASANPAFGGSPPEPHVLAPSLAAVDSIRDYIGGPRLAADKRRGVTREWNGLLDSAADALEHGRAELRTRADELGMALARSREQSAELDAAHQRLSATVNERRADLDVAHRRLGALEIFLSGGELPNPVDPDPELAAFGRFAIGESGIAIEHPRLTTTDERDIKRDLEATVLGWANGRHGVRSLSSLAVSVWDRTETAGARTLRDRYVAMANEAIRVVRSALAARVDGTLSAAVRAVPDDALAAKGENPLVPGRPLDQLDLPKVTWRKRSAAAVWRDNERPVKDKFLRAPDRIYESLATQVWGPPWDLRRHFSLDGMREAAESALVPVVGAKWAELLRQRAPVDERELSRLETERIEREQEHGRVRQEIERIEAEMALIDDALRMLSARAQAVSQLAARPLP